MVMALLSLTAGAQTETETAAPNDTLLVDDVIVVRGSQATATVNYEFASDYYGFQLETRLPDFTIGRTCYPSDALYELGYNIGYGRLPSGIDRFTAINFNFEPIPTGQGKLFDFIVNAPASLATGVYPATFQYVEFSDEYGTVHLLKSVTFNVIVVDPDDSYIPIDEEHFPDPDFRKWITDNIPNGPDGSGGGGRVIPGAVIPTITFLDVHGCGIHDLSGIEYFPYLEIIYFYDNHLSGIDTSGNSHLRVIHGWDNGMMGYDGSGNGSLSDVRLSKQTIHATVYNRHGKWGFHTTEWGFDLGRVGNLQVSGSGGSGGAGGSGGIGFLGGPDQSTASGNCGCWWWFDYDGIPSGMTYVYYIDGDGTGGSGGRTMEVEVILEPEIRGVDITPDGDNDLDDLDDELVDVTLDGFTFSPDRWITFCVPFNASMEKMQEAFGENVDIEELVRSTWDAPNLFLMLYFDPRQEIVAGKPYVLKVDATVENPQFKGVTIVNTTPETITIEYCQMTGVFRPTPLTADDKSTLFISNNHFFHPTTNEALPATKCYFTLIGDAQQANGMGLAFEAADGIVETIGQAAASADYYSLQGVRTRVPQRGIYIHNGRKVVVK